MINLSSDTEDSFDLYKKAVGRKHKSPQKTELLSIEQQVKERYDEYKVHYGSNTIEQLNQSDVGHEHKDVLLDLYSSNAVIIKHFRERFFQRNPQTYNNLCPYCSINEANTTDHILPKEQYPEYAIDTLNLIPACSNCNSLKGDNVVNDKGEKITINFYRDTLPKEQYLYVDFQVMGTSIKATYYIHNKGKIPDDIFALIKRHFDKLGLIDRFNYKAIQEISELTNLYFIEKFSSENEYNIFATKQLQKTKMDKLSLGYNHWRVILYQSAATSKVFKSYILSKIQAI